MRNREDSKLISIGDLVSIGDTTERVNTGKGTDLGEGRLEKIINLSIL